MKKTKKKHGTCAVLVLDKATEDVVNRWEDLVFDSPAYKSAAHSALESVKASGGKYTIRILHQQEGS